MRAFILIISAIVLFPFAGKPQTRSLTEAEKQKLIQFSIHGNEGSTHYIRPLLLEVKNISNSITNLKIENGLVLQANDSSYQNFVVTNEEILSLKPGQETEIQLFAMCLESSDASPGATSVYHPTILADSSLLGLTHKIEKEKLFNYEAQTAVWALSCKYPIDYITGFDTVLTRQLIGYVADETGQELPPPPAPDDYERNYYSTSTYKLKMSGEFSYNLYENRSITIAMFDKDNIVVRELYKNTVEKPGDHKLKFEFDATAYTDDFYYLKVIDNGDVAIEMKVDIPKRNRG
jgi:hypothetical protein